jgi:hypothetical protein
VFTCHFHAVPAQAWPKMRAGPCSSPCRDSGHITALVFMSCRHGPKYFVSCCASSRAKRPCYDPPSNGTAQVLTLVPDEFPNGLTLYGAPPHHLSRTYIVQRHTIQADLYPFSLAFSSTACIGGRWKWDHSTDGSKATACDIGYFHRQFKSNRL